MAKKNLSSEKARKIYSPPNATIISSTALTDSVVCGIGLTKEEKLKRYEKFRSSGDFEKDFKELCSLLDLQINIRHRCKLPTMTTMTTNRGENETKMKDDKKNNCSRDTCSLAEHEGCPATYVVTKNDHDYFQPCVEIVSDNEAGKDFVKAVYVRGWKVNQCSVAVLTKFIPELDHLTNLDLWNAGLNDETLDTVGKSVAASPSLQALSLDGNSFVRNQRFDVFLNNDGKNALQNLSLRNCHLKEEGAAYLGEALSTNKHLLTLNLCFNKIGDVGVCRIAEGLRINRTLLSLNVGCNGITDIGVKSISETISTFPLTHEQIVTKRLKMSEFIGDVFAPLKRGSMLATPSNSRTQSGKTKDKEHRGSLKKRDSIKAKDIGTRRDRLSSESIKVQKVQKPKNPVKVEVVKSPLQSEEMDGSEFMNPLLEKTNHVNGELWIPGNRSLININLSRNRVSKLGLQFLYRSVLYQVELARETNCINGCGIMRICLQNNPINVDDSTYIALIALLKSRDPIRKEVSGEEVNAFS